MMKYPAERDKAIPRRIQENSYFDSESCKEALVGEITVTYLCICFTFSGKTPFRPLRNPWDNFKVLGYCDWDNAQTRAIPGPMA